MKKNKNLLLCPSGLIVNIKFIKCIYYSSIDKVYKIAFLPKGSIELLTISEEDYKFIVYYTT